MARYVRGTLDLEALRTHKKGDPSPIILHPAPFGGIQVITVGDFHQLPPVCKRDPDNPFADRGPRFAFQSDRWRACGFVPVLLEKVFRQVRFDDLSRREESKEQRIVEDKAEGGGEESKRDNRRGCCPLTPHCDSFNARLAG